MVDRSWFKVLMRLVAMLTIGAATPALAAPACVATPKVGRTVGPYSPVAVQAGKVPLISGLAGLSCDNSFIVLLGGNVIEATLTSQNGMKLASGANRIPYTAYADAAAKVALPDGVTRNYAQNNVLDILGLLAGGNTAMPLYIKVAGGTAPPAGIYKDVITIAWSWKLCKTLYLLGACSPMSGYDAGTATSEFTITVEVTAQDMTIALSSVATWDAVNGALRPLALPGSKGRASLIVRNPDIVPLDGGSISIAYAVPAKTSIALDGDGTLFSQVVSFSDGSPASGASLNYASAASTIDDVDFSSDNGATWTYAPVAGNRASEALITNVRFRPRGAMNAGSSFTVSFPYLVR